MSSVNSTSPVAMYETLSKRDKEELVVQNYISLVFIKNLSVGNLGGNA